MLQNFLSLNRGTKINFWVLFDCSIFRNKLIFLWKSEKYFKIFRNVKNPNPNKLEICMRMLWEETSTKQILGRLFIGWTVRLIFYVAKNSSCRLFNVLRRGMHLLNFRKHMRGMQSMYLFNLYLFILLRSLSFNISNVWDMQNTPPSQCIYN